MRYCALLLAAMAVACGGSDSPVVTDAAAQRSAAEGGAGGRAENRYIVVFAPGVANPEAAANALLRAHGGTLGFVYRHALSGFSAELPAPAVEAIARNPIVSYVESDQIMEAFAQNVPTGVRRTFADQNAALTIDGNDDRRVDVDVAVIDTGIDFDHADLNVLGRTDCSGGGPFKASCSDASGDDGDGHGTHVAGTIGAIDNGIGVVGVAPGARLWAVKVLSDNGTGWNSGVIAGVDWVTARATTIEVANMSLGGGTSQALCTAIGNSVSKGVVYAVAAGNSDDDAANYSPANCRDVITVSALADFNGLPGGGGTPTCRTDQDDTLADFSNWSKTIDMIAAPGVCILSTWKGGGYATISGTSMASPHVAGAAAVLKASGVIAPRDVRNALLGNGNGDWIDDSGDGVREPLLSLLDNTVFKPQLVAGSSGGTGGGTTPPSAFSLSAAPLKVKGVQHASLEWTGATSASVDIFRDGATIDTVASDPGVYDDNIGKKGGGSYVYRVCEVGTTTCSNEATVTF